MDGYAADRTLRTDVGVHLDAAAGFGVLSDSTSMAKLNFYSIECCRRLEPQTAQFCGMHTTGGLYLAETDIRVDHLRIMEAKARHLGFAFEFVPVEDIRSHHPFINTDRLKGAWFQPEEGHLDPSGITQTFARGTRRGAASIERFCRVVETDPHLEGGWDVVTEKGTVTAGIVVNAAGLWAREVASMAGIDLSEMPPVQTLVGFEVDVDGADSAGSEPILLDGRVVGDVTSGAYGHSVGKSPALSYLDTSAIDPNAHYDISIVGEPRPARLLAVAPFDPSGTLARR